MGNISNMIGKKLDLDFNILMENERKSESNMPMNKSSE